MTVEAVPLNSDPADQASDVRFPAASYAVVYVEFEEVPRESPPDNWFGPGAAVVSPYLAAPVPDVVRFPCQSYWYASADGLGPGCS